jgi:hypothetical protein
MESTYLSEVFHDDSSVRSLLGFVCVSIEHGTSHVVIAIAISLQTHGRSAILPKKHSVGRRALL